MLHDRRLVAIIWSPCWQAVILRCSFFSLAGARLGTILSEAVTFGPNRSLLFGSPTLYGGFGSGDAFCSLASSRPVSSPHISPQYAGHGAVVWRPEWKSRRIPGGFFISGPRHPPPL